MNNSFAGTLPDALWETVWLRSLNLNSNKLSGTISNRSTAYTLQVSHVIPAFGYTWLHVCQCCAALVPLNNFVLS